MNLKSKFTVLAMATLIFSMVIYSCKKTDLDPDDYNAKIEMIKQKFKDAPLSITQVVNIEGKGYYSDIEGNKISIRKNQSITNSIKSNFEMLGSSCPEPGDAEFSQTFLSMDREFTCGTGYRFVVRYKVISEFYPVFSLSPTQISTGRIRLKNSSGVYYYITPTTSKSPVNSIINNGVVGQNSFGEDLNEFIISYRTEYITESQYNSAVAVEPSIYAYSDCPNYFYNLPFSPQQSAIGYQQNSLPCTRIDKVKWHPSDGSMPPSVIGANVSPLPCFPYGYVFPHKQEIQFKNGSGAWKNFYLHINNLGQPGVETALINYWDTWFIDMPRSQTNNGLVPGNVQVRYRNNQMGTSANGGPCVTEPNDTWIYETWYLN